MRWPIYFIFLLIVLILCITPFLTRKTESFGVSVPYDQYRHPKLQRFRKNYFYQTGILGLLFFILLIISSKLLGEVQWVWLFVAAIFVYIFGSFVIYLFFHKKVRELKKTENWKEKKREVVAIDIRFSTEKKTYSGGWFLIPLAITAFTAFHLWDHYDQIPDKFPMQYDFSGKVTKWADKSIGTLLFFPLQQLLITGIFFFINRVIEKSKQQLDAEHPETSLRQNILFRRRWSIFTIVSCMAMTGLFLLPVLQLTYPMNPQVLFSVSIAIPFVIMIGAFLLSILTGQGGSRIKLDSGKGKNQVNRDDDRYWKLGQFYFNPEDPALWVEKRFGVGWTMNFARPGAWVFLLAIFLIPIFILLLTM